jgi:hypothetical protein
MLAADTRLNDLWNPVESATPAAEQESSIGHEFEISWLSVEHHLCVERRSQAVHY